MVREKTIPWYEIDEVIPDLETDVEHKIQVQREALPLIFIPGIMGSRLRRTGTDGTGKDGDGYPNMRWDPSDKKWMWWYYSGKDAAWRKAMLVGENFDEGYLEVANDNPVGDGCSGIMSDYCEKFLEPLRKHDWGPLAKIFEFPVYAVGYNWTDDTVNSGKQLAIRIDEIITEARKVTGLCEKAILLTHSMGGLVSRWATEMAGAGGQVLGVVHGVQPATGAAAGYWRMKAGFEAQGLLDIKGKATSRSLGNTGRQVTAVLANIPGGLQLLPNKSYKTNDGSTTWLRITEGGKIRAALPSSNPPDPYDDIYRIKAIVEPAPGEKPSMNSYWGLVDPDLLDPGRKKSNKGRAAGDNNALDADLSPKGDPWEQYKSLLDLAEAFHDQLGTGAHTRRFCFSGFGTDTADFVELRIQGRWGRKESYPKRGFRGFLTSPKGKKQAAVLQDPAGDGDSTVPRSSAQAVDDPDAPAPGNVLLEVKHQPAYEYDAASKYAIEAITALCGMHFQDRRSSGGAKGSAAGGGG